MNNRNYVIASIVGLVLFVIGCLIGSGAKLGHCGCCSGCQAVGIYWATECKPDDHKPDPQPKPQPKPEIRPSPQPGSIGAGA